MRACVRSNICKKMKFESLPNEIILDLFDYFDGIELFDLFYELNQRFTWLLYRQYRTFRLNFTSISKRKFDFICQQHLPNLTEHVYSLSLSNGIETIQQIEIFLLFQPSIENFLHLQSLTLSYLDTYEIIIKIIRQCSRIHHLKFYRCNFTIKRSDFQSIIDGIWSLTNLIHCEMDDISERRLGFCIPTKISTSLQRLTWIKFIVKLNEINTLYEYTPNLRHLSISISDPHIDYQPSILPSLRSAHFIFHTFDLLDIRLFFQNIPNLSRLNIEILFNLIDGYEWKKMISQYLPRLRRFDFHMKSTFASDENMNELVRSYIESFRNSFWITKHQWFVRCYSCKTTIYLSTLSNQCAHTDTFPDQFLSTHSQDSLQKFSNNLIEVSDENFFDNPLPTTIRFMNIQSLTIQFPISKQFWSIVSNFDCLRQLTIYVNTNTTQTELNRLFDRIFHLDRLSINETIPLCFQESTLNALRTTIDQFDIQGCESSINIIHLSLIRHCQVLFIQIDNHENILDLIKHLPNLRALIIRYDENLSIEWLKEHLSSTYSIDRDLGFDKPICIWK